MAWTHKKAKYERSFYPPSMREAKSKSDSIVSELQVRFGLPFILSTHSPFSLLRVATSASFSCVLTCASVHLLTNAFLTGSLWPPVLVPFSQPYTHVYTLLILDPFSLLQSVHQELFPDDDSDCFAVAIRKNKEKRQQERQRQRQNGEQAAQGANRKT